LAEIILQFVELEFRQFTIVRESVHFTPVGYETLAFVYVVGGVIGFVMEQDTVFALHVLLKEILCVAYGVHTMHIGQVDEYVRISTDHYEFAIWVIGLDGLCNGCGSYVFANATL
jgi:hypothetical protein